MSIPKMPVALKSLANLGLASVLAVSMASGAQAVTITYELSGNHLSGSLGGIVFSDANYDISATADTDDVQFTTFAGILPIYKLVPATSTITISGFGSATFTSSNFGVTSFNAIALLGSNQVGFADFRSSSNAPGFGLLLSQFDDLAHDVSYTGNTGVGKTTYGTSLGDLIVTSGTGTGAFTATSVPEPASAVLMALGLAGLGASRRRRESAATAA